MTVYFLVILLLNDDKKVPDLIVHFHNPQQVHLIELLFGERCHFEPIEINIEFISLLDFEIFEFINFLQAHVDRHVMVKAVLFFYFF